MKVKLLASLFVFFFLNQLSLNAQKTYTITSGEIIFSWANLELTDAFQNAYPSARIIDTPTRFTFFLHLSQYLHLNFTDNVGFISGLSLRNVGFISDEILPAVPNPTSETDYQGYKIVRRLYNVGVPLALKLGSFKNNVYLFGGGEIEWGVHMKEKWWNDNQRSGTKTKNTKWFPTNTQVVNPSLFVGVQFPRGLNLKFKYYTNDFINREFAGNGLASDVSNLTRYKRSQTMYVSISWQLLRDFKFDY